MRLGIFGGSFDPVHNGHLTLARVCQAQVALDEVWFTPTAVQPLKRGGPQAAAAQRVAMLNLAIESEVIDATGSQRRPKWSVCTLEIDRGGFSYTVDTLREIRAELPTAELFFLLGADALRDVPRWYQPAEIFRLSTPLVVARAGQPEPDLDALRLLCLQEHAPLLVEMPAVPVSSTDIRRRILTGQPIDDLVPAAVAAYIASQRLYSREH